MPFWDRFVLWVYLGLADVLPVGRDAVNRLFERIYASGQLDLRLANDLTVLLVAGACRPGGPARLAAEAQIGSRQLGRQYERVRSLLRTLAAPRLTEILELNRPHRAVAAQLLTGVLASDPGHETWTNLTEFLSRINAAAPGTVRGRATNNLLGAIQRYFRFPLGTVGYVSLLYRHACGYLGIGTAALPVYGSDPAAMAAVADQAERTFLVRCGTQLTDADRVLLFVHFYGRLTADQLAGMLQFTDPTWTPDLVAAEVERCWIAVL